MMLSVLIPSRNEPYLERTIQDVLKNARGEIEVIACLDGYKPDPQIDLKDKRVTFLHWDTPQGHRKIVNEAARRAKGEHIMKCDAHCAFDEGFDVKLVEAAKELGPEVTQVPRMFNLDRHSWTPKIHKRTDYMYIGMDRGRELRAEYYRGKLYRELHSNPAEIDETMACMGPCWFLSKDRFWEQGGCDEAAGGWGQQGVEVSLKAWLSGGRLVVNKRTWFAHWFRGGDGGFVYPISGKDIENTRAYSRDLWLNDKWPGAKRPISWLFDKFKPPIEDQAPKPEPDLTEEERVLCDKFHHLFFRQWNKYPRKWLGTQIVKYPTDMLIYHMLIHRNKPDVIIEVGSFMGGGALFFASMCDIVGHGNVIGVDKREIKRPEHLRLEFIVGRSTEASTLAKVAEKVRGKTCMVVLDSDHRRIQVKRELMFYSKFVTKGQYLVVEDTMLGNPIPWRYGPENAPGPAVKWFLERHPEFKAEPHENQFLISMNPGGWLLKT